MHHMVRSIHQVEMSLTLRDKHMNRDRLRVTAPLQQHFPRVKEKQS